jgi:hypothetical protein
MLSQENTNNIRKLLRQPDSARQDKSRSKQTLNELKFAMAFPVKVSLHPSRSSISKRQKKLFTNITVEMGAKYIQDEN